MNRPHRGTIRAAVVTTVIAASTLAWAAPAHAAAATLDVSGQIIYYTAGAGQPNHLVIERSSANPDIYIFSEVGGQAISSTDPACSFAFPGNPTIMTCTAPGILTLVVDVADGDDAVLNWTDRAAFLYGGSGNDSLHLGGRVGVQSRGYGGTGNDSLTSGPGNDIMDGGADTDSVGYGDSVDPVQASLATNSGGRYFDTDTYYGVEGLSGGGANDVLYGNDAANTLSGGSRAILCGQVRGGGCVYISGNDHIYAGGGDDTILTEGGNDVAYGGAGNDVLWGDAGDDWLVGDAGNDTLYGGTGANILNGGTGTDACYQGAASQCEN